jgi:predicted anti-sigma-YlaC factor YlaD
VNCDEARETVSAAADGEASAAERATLDVHLGGCAGCRAFLRRVEQVGRMARVRPAEPVPDLVGRVTGGAGPLRLGRGGWMRPALAWVAVVLAGQNVPALVLGETAGADSHLARHLGAFGVALAIGFAYVAWRPHRAIGLLPLVAALVATMVASTAFDLLGGDRSPLAEAVHLPELAGLALLWMIAGSPGWRGRSRRVEAGSVPTT